MYCRNCGEKIPDDARFCNHCGTPVVPVMPEKPGIAVEKEKAPSDARTEEDRQCSRDTQEHELKFRGNMVSCDGHAVHKNNDDDDDRKDHERTEHEKKKGSGLVLFIVLGAAIIFLSAAIAWQVITLVEINRDSTNFKLPSATEETGLTPEEEAGSATESNEPAETNTTAEANATAGTSAPAGTPAPASGGD